MNAASAEANKLRQRVPPDSGTTVETQDVTGCVLDEDADVMSIIDALSRLETIYL